MADYKIAIAKVLPIEGYILNKKVGYVNDNDDTGKETVGGISRVFWPHSAIWPIVDAAKLLPNFPANLVKNMQLYNLLIEFYRVNFWNLVGGDQISDQDIADMLVDSAVNEGIKPAIRRAQNIVGLAQTGISDLELIKRLNSMI